MNVINKAVYLAGPIRGLTLEEAVEWRERFAELMHNRIEVRSPMRLKKTELPYDTPLDLPGIQYEGLFTTQKAIVTRDRVDCTTSGVIVMNLLGAEAISIGSMVEVGWADAFRIPIVLLMEEEGNVHDHFFTKEIPCWRVQCAIDAARVVHSLLNVPCDHLDIIEAKQ